MAKKILEVKNLKKYFPLQTNFFGKTQSWVRAVDDVSIYIEEGKTLGIVGESGCGKTTLGRTILRLHEPTDGKIFFEGEDITHISKKELRKLRPQMQIIFQDPFSSLSPRMPVGEIIGEAVRFHKIVPKEEHKDYIFDVMRKCGLQTHYYERYPHEFSGGQRQRICIARALALNPRLVICDEPVSALDVSIQAQIINLLKDLQKDFGFSYMFISHDLSVVEHISDNVGVMYLGSVVESGPKEKIFANPMHPYTKALFSAVPVPDPNVKMNRIILKGDIPSPAHPPKGCKFHTRCKECMDICKEITPFFNEYEPGHFCACHLYAQNHQAINNYMILKEYLKGYFATPEKIEQIKALSDRKLVSYDSLAVKLFIIGDNVEMYIKGKGKDIIDFNKKYSPAEDAEEGNEEIANIRAEIVGERKLSRVPIKFTIDDENKLHAAKELIDLLMNANGFSKSANGEVTCTFTSSDDNERRSGSVMSIKPLIVDFELKARKEAKEAAEALKNKKD